MVSIPYLRVCVCMCLGSKMENPVPPNLLERILQYSRNTAQKPMHNSTGDQHKAQSPEETRKGYVPQTRNIVERLI